MSLDVRLIRQREMRTSWSDRRGNQLTVPSSSWVIRSARYVGVHVPFSTLSVIFPRERGAMKVISRARGTRGANNDCLLDCFFFFSLLHEVFTTRSRIAIGFPSNPHVRLFVKIFNISYRAKSLFRQKNYIPCSSRSNYQVRNIHSTCSYLLHFFFVRTSQASRF